MHLPRSAVVFLIATLLAVMMALLLGTKFGPAIVVVASAYGVCFAVSVLLRLFARLERSDSGIASLR